MARAGWHDEGAKHAQYARQAVAAARARAGVEEDRVARALSFESSHDQPSRISWNHPRRRRCAGAHSGAAPRTSSSRAESSFSGPFRLPARCSRSSASRSGTTPSQDPAALKEVLKRWSTTAAEFLDTMHQSVPGVEELTATAATELGIQDKLFLVDAGVTLRPAARPAPRPRKRRSRRCSTTFKVSKIDLVLLPVQADPAQLRRPEGAEEGGARPVHRRDGRSRKERYPAARGDHAQRADRLHRRRLRHRAIAAPRRRSCRSPRSGRSA